MQISTWKYLEIQPPFLVEYEVLPGDMATNAKNIKTMLQSLI
jgi:hypothetical protein